MPALYGLIAQHISASLLPVYLAMFLLLMVVNLELLNRKNKKNVELVGK